MKKFFIISLVILSILFSSCSFPPRSTEPAPTTPEANDKPNPDDSGNESDDYSEQGFNQDVFDQANASVAMDIIQAGQYGLSSSTMTTTGSIEKNSNLLIVEDSGDFEVGQGIAIDGLERMSNGKLTYFVNKIKAIEKIENGKAKITLEYKKAPGTAENVLIKHDNYYAFIEIFEKYNSQQNISFKLPKGDYEINAIRISKPGNVPGKFEYRNTEEDLITPNGISQTLFYFREKNSIHIDFSGSNIFLNNDFYLGYDYDYFLNNVAYPRSFISPLTFIQIGDSSNVIIENLNLNGGIETSSRHPDLGEPQVFGINYIGVVNSLIRNCNFSYMATDGVKFSLGSKNTYTGNITLKNVTSNHNARQGLSVGSMSNLLIKDCEFSYTGFCGSYKAHDPSRGIDFEFASLNTCFENMVVQNSKFIDNYNGHIVVSETADATNTKKRMGKPSVIFDGCLFFSGSGYDIDFGSDISDFWISGGDNQITIKNSIIINENKKEQNENGKLIAGRTIFIRDHQEETKFINNVFLGYMYFKVWAGNVHSFGNYYLLDYNGTFENTNYNILLKKSESSVLSFENDCIYFSKKAYMSSFLLYNSVFREVNNMYGIGGYDMKNVKILSETDFIIPSKIGNSGISSYDNVTIFGGIKTNDYIDTAGFLDFYTYSGRRFSTENTNSALKIKSCYELNISDLNNVKTEFQNKKNSILKIVLEEKLNYSDSSTDEPDGSENNPFLIGSARELKKIAEKPQANYKLVSDIDFCWETVEPLCTTLSAPFSGVLDGNGYKIKNIIVKGYGATGIFKYLNGTVKNLEIENPIVTGTTAADNTAYTGVIAGLSTGGIIDNCRITGNGKVTGDTYVGGLIGRSYESKCTLRNNSVSIEVSGNNYIGGLLGGGPVNAIENCRFLGNITGLNNVGGLAGLVSGLDVIIERSDTAGNVTGTDYVGGLVGRITGSGKIENCFSTANVLGITNTGGLFGGITTTTEVLNCYFAGSLK